MPGCATRCTSYRTDDRDNAWYDIRSHFGPRTSIGSTIYMNDIGDWTLWASDNGYDPVVDVEVFGKWLIWKCSFGTTNMGNLPTRKRDHTGISCIPCPYDASTEVARARIWLGLSDTDPFPSRTDHGDYYMKVSQRGNSWGFECTYSGCTYLIDNGIPYFHA